MYKQSFTQTTDQEIVMWTFIFIICGIALVLAGLTRMVNRSLLKRCEEAEKYHQKEIDGIEKAIASMDLSPEVPEVNEEFRLLKEDMEEDLRRKVRARMDIKTRIQETAGRLKKNPFAIQ